jgi:hypothetical protein
MSVSNKLPASLLELLLNVVLLMLEGLFYRLTLRAFIFCAMVAEQMHSSL